MTKQELVSAAAQQTGVERATVSAIVEAFMEQIRNSLTNDENVYLRGSELFS